MSNVIKSKNAHLETMMRGAQYLEKIKVGSFEAAKHTQIMSSLSLF